MVTFVELGTRHPLRDWMAQRATAVLMVVYVFIFFRALALQPDATYESWHAVFLPAWMRAATLLVFAALCFHVWVGMRNIYMDYVKPQALRAALKLATVAVLLAYAGWMACLLWRLT